MFKKFIHWWKLVAKLSAPITHERLMSAGFDYYHPFYAISDLVIEVDIIKRKYYYVDSSGLQREIKIMKQVSDLVFGVIGYGK